MKIEQKRVAPFEPIIFTIESREEAEVFLGIIRCTPMTEAPSHRNTMVRSISDYFSNSARL